ncbi:hypothetical protein ES707_22862 [subsurface metagenome]
MPNTHAKSWDLFPVVSLFSSILVRAYVPPVLNIKAAPDPKSIIKTKNLAFHESVITSFIQSNEVAIAANGCPPVKIKPPTQILINREKITRFVHIAKAIATSGGIIDQNPNIFSFSF